MTKEERRARDIAKAIRLTWSSLKSHLPYAYEGEMVRGEDHLFHQRAIADYAKVILILSKLY